MSKVLYFIASAGIVILLALFADLVMANGKPETLPTPVQPQKQQQGQVQGQQQMQTARSESTSSLSNANSVSIAHERAAASAFAPGVAVAPGTCYASQGIGVQGVGFGLSGSRLDLDEGCVVGRSVNMALAVGMDAATVREVACMDPMLRKTGQCKDMLPPEPEPRITDPIVRQRMGLPALE